MLISRSRVQPFTTIKFLAATTAMSTAILPVALLGAGVVAGSTMHARADDSVMLPLEHFNKDDSSGEYTRLGIRVGINGSAPRLYLFDTGSDQFNAQIDSKTKVKPVGDVKVYAYGDSSYGNLVQNVEAGQLSYYDKDKPAFEHSSTYYIGRSVDIIYTKNSSQLKLNNDIRLSNEPVRDNHGKIQNNNGDPYYADLNAREKNDSGKPAESDGSYGTFGVGDFIFTSSANSSAIGGLTTSGYIVAANANLANEATPGCAPCAIVDLDAAQRAQFTAFVPWEVKHDQYERPTFPGSGANASTQYEGEYRYTFKFKVNGEQKTVTLNGPVLLDTGTADEVFLSQKDAIKALADAGLVVKEGNDSDPNNGKIDSFSVQKPGEDHSVVEFDNIKLSRLSGEGNGTGITIGLPFFHENSVMYDLEKQSTAYTPYFVSANDFTTSASNTDELRLNRITAQMGSQWQRDKLDADGQPVLDKDGKPVQESIGSLGIAGVISGAGDLTIGSNADVRMTNINSYTGATYINNGADLSLAGLGSIEGSAKVVADGTLDISEHGKANDYWGIPNSENDARIRSLSGGSTGVVELGDRTLVLTAANDAFAGRIEDLDDQKKNMGGGLLVAGGVQTLSGKNDYSGMTTVDAGAGLLLAGSITHDVTTSGLLGNDGQIGGLAQANKDGVIVGAGSFGAVTIADGGKVAPGSAFDPGRPIATLTVDGDFVQQAGSTYEADVAMPGDTSDRINVTGRATIESGAAVEIVRQGAGKLSVGARYALLNAAQGVRGTYNSLTGTLVTDSPFVDFDLTYDPTVVYLGVDRTATAFADVGKTFNQRSVAAASEALGSGNAVYDNILFLTEGGSRAAFDQLSGEIHASAHSAFIEDSHFVRDAASDRIRAAFDGVGASPVPVMSYGPGGPEIAPADGDRLAVWGRGFGAWGHLDGDGNAARLDRSTGGFLAGADTLVGQDWRLGLLAGYSHTSFEVDDRMSSGSSENYHLGAYAGTQWGKLGFRSGLAYTWHRLDTDRSVAFPGFSDSLSSDYDAGAFQAFGELGYRVDTPMAAFEPYGNLAYVHLKTDGFREEGGAAALNGRGESSDTTFTTLGLRASADLQLGAVPATARGGIGWRHAFGDVTPEATLAFAGGDAFAVRGTPIAKDAALVEAGLDVNVTRNASIGLAYQGQIASSAQEHGFNAKLDVRF